VRFMVKTGEAIPPEAPKPVRCCFKGKKVRLGIKKGWG
jgi:hypothetical protein